MIVQFTSKFLFSKVLNPEENEEIRKASGGGALMLYPKPTVEASR